jgi:hypothetical protein
MPAMSGEHEYAYAVARQNEDQIRENARFMRNIWSVWNIVLPWRYWSNMRRAFTGFANISENKLNSDLIWLKYKTDQEKHKLLVKERGW